MASAPDYGFATDRRIPEMDAARNQRPAELDARERGGSWMVKEHVEIEWCRSLEVQIPRGMSWVNGDGISRFKHLTQ